MDSFAMITPEGAAGMALADVCHICHRAPVRAPTDDGRRSKACAPCVAIDAHLATTFGLKLLSPIDDTWGTGDQVLHHRLWGPAAQGVATRLRDHHSSATMRLNGRAESVGVRHLLARFPAGPLWASWLRWDAWQAQFPPSLDMSVRGYQAYVVAVHPWIDSVEPRVADITWLSDQAKHPG